MGDRVNRKRELPVCQARARAPTMPVRRRRAGRRGTPTRRDPRQSPAQEGDAPTEVRTSAACHPTPRALSPPPVSPSGVVPGVASPTPVSRGSGASSQQGESGTAWGEGHAWARGAWGEPQVWSPSHELCAHLPAEPGGRGPPPWCPSSLSAAVVRGEQATSQPAGSLPTPLTVWFVGPPGAPPASRLATLGALVGGVV